MSKLSWDGVGERLYNLGVSKGVLFPMLKGKYQKGVAWNGLTAVNETPDGADANDTYADNIKYAVLRSAENFKYRDNPLDQLPRITPHTLRHTFCTRLVMSGMNIKTVQYLMGHSTVSVTLNVYSHIRSSADVIKEFREKLPVLGCTPTSGLDSYAKELPELVQTRGVIRRFDPEFGDLV